MLRNYTAYFIVEVYDGEESRHDAGFVSANTLGEAMDYIEEYYGEELMAVKHMELIDCSMLVMTPELAEKVYHEV